MTVPANASLTEILTDYRDQVRIALYQNAPDPCPPPLYAALLQPTFPTYAPLTAADLGTIAVPAGSGITARRLQARFPVPPGTPPQLFTGWFAFVELDDASKKVLQVTPFPAPIALTPAVSVILIQSDVAVGAGAGPGGLDLLTADQVVITSAGGRSMKVFRGEQRQSLISEVAILRKLLGWDTDLVNRPDNSKLAPVPLITGVPTTLVKHAGPPVVYYTGDEIAVQLLTRAGGLLDLTASPVPA